jgi:Mg-chelatase subunit ChlI
LEGRTQLTERDIALAAELALPHRMRRGPFHQADMNPEQLQARIEQVQSEFAGADEQDAASTEEDPSAKKKRGGTP